MRRFHSYGPVDCEEHFCVPRPELRRQCLEQLVGHPEKGGHFFTIWAPRQTGKTWLMERVGESICEAHGNRLQVGVMSMQGIILGENDSAEAFFRQTPRLFLEAFGMERETPQTWEDWIAPFSAHNGLFKKPVILFIDEFDALPAVIIDTLVALFRNMYLKRSAYHLHGLALVGVRAVLGVDSQRGSPFNVQRSLHVPNFSREEVKALFDQYQTESDQGIEPEVVNRLFDATRGQPGLVCWMGELLTETYNPGMDRTIGVEDWKLVYHKACFAEWNNTILNLVKKAQSRYPDYVVRLFADADVEFRLDAEWCAYLYLNGIIDRETRREQSGEYREICRFSSPFVQRRLYNALTHDVVGDQLPILALEPLDDLADVFSGTSLNVPALLERYRDYLHRLRAKGLNPWREQPRRADLRLTEAVGHFHLYAWLLQAVGRQCAVIPEFPTGNGRVDIRLRSGNQEAILEIKSFLDWNELRRSRRQAAAYARQMEMEGVTLAVFVASKDPHVLETLSTTETLDGVTVTTVAIGGFD